MKGACNKNGNNIGNQCIWNNFHSFAVGILMTLFNIKLFLLQIGANSRAHFLHNQNDNLREKIPSSTHTSDFGFIKEVQIYATL